MELWTRVTGGNAAAPPALKTLLQRPHAQPSPTHAHAGAGTTGRRARTVAPTLAEPGPTTHARATLGARAGGAEPPAPAATPAPQTPGRFKPEKATSRETVIVTAASENHLCTLLRMLQDLNRTLPRTKVRPWPPPCHGCNRHRRARQGCTAAASGIGVHSRRRRPAARARACVCGGGARAGGGGGGRGACARHGCMLRMSCRQDWPCGMCPPINVQHGTPRQFPCDGARLLGMAWHAQHRMHTDTCVVHDS